MLGGRFARTNIKGSTVPLDVTCPNCKAINTFYYSGKYKCIKCKEIINIQYINPSNKKRRIKKGTVELAEIDLEDINRPLPYKPNYISRFDRVFLLFTSVFYVIYGIIGLIKDDIYIRSTGSYRIDIHLHGFPAVIMFIGFLTLAIAYGSIIVDHYDKRDNEKKYRMFLDNASKILYFLFYGAIFLQQIANGIKYLMEKIA